MKKLFRITTNSISLDILLKGQLKYLSSFYDVTAISSGTDESLKRIKDRENVKVKNISMLRDISFFRDILSFFHLFFYFVRERPYIVHANTPKASLLSMAAAFFAFVPHRVYTVTGLRFETAHGVFRFILVNMERLTCFFSNKIIPEGKGVQNKLLRYKITTKPLSIIHNGNINGIDTHFFDKEVFLSEINIDPYLKYKKGITFVFVGRLVKDKGISELYQSFVSFQKKTNRDSSLILVGDFEDSSNALDDELISNLKQHKDIYLTGFQKDIRPFLAVSDVFLFSSYREGFPNVLLQAASMSLPLISTMVSGADEIITEGVNGFLIPIHDSESLLSKMITFNDNRELMVSMGNKGREIIVKCFKQEDLWEKILEMYNQL